MSQEPVLDLVSIKLECPAYDGHGIKIILKGSKPKGKEDEEEQLIIPSFVSPYVFLFRFLLLIS